MISPDLEIGFACDNRCNFCARRNKRRVIPRKSLTQIIEELRREVERGGRAVVFTGGEPTLHPKLLEAVAAARRHGYDKIQVQTNGRRFVYADFRRSLKRAGVNEFSPSLHGSTSDRHDSMTCARGAWEHVVAGVRNLKALGAHVPTDTVVTRQNFMDFPDLARLLVYLRVDQFQFAFVHVAGTAEANAAGIVPQIAETPPFRGKASASAAGPACAA